MAEGRFAASGSFYQLGPDLGDQANLHQTRPYFLLPLTCPRDDSGESVDLAVRAEQRLAIQRIQDWVRFSAQEEIELPTSSASSGDEPLATRKRPKGRVTDIYVLSHGWHRNIFQAVSAYDRISSRLAVLMHRGRLPLPEPYHPIFINLHWHSDPGKNGWVDPSGRRDKDSFFENVRSRFAGRGPHFKNVFEDVFELFQTVSAPGVDAFAPGLADRSRQLMAELSKEDLEDAPGATDFDKCVAAWTCYHEAEPRKMATPQREGPAPYLSTLRAVWVLLAFVAAIVGVGAVLSVFTSVDWFGGGTVLEWLRRGWDGLRNAAMDRGLAPRVGWLSPNAVFALEMVALGYVQAMAVQLGFSRSARAQPPTDEPARVGPVVLASWAYTLLLHSLPLLATLLATYLVGPVGSFLARSRRGEAGWVYRERWTGHRTRLLTLPLSKFARIPNTLLKRALTESARLATPIDAADAQLAFWEMQEKAVQAAAEAAEIIGGLFDSTPELDGARIHLCGHSFGGLLVANLAERLTNHVDLSKVTHPPEAAAVRTLLTLNGALASHWFARQPQVVEGVTGTIACLFSRYDSANRVYYPLANKARKSQGYVGLCWVPGHSEQPAAPCPRDCNRDHVHRTLAFATLADPPRTVSAHPAVINVDGSRLMVQGPIATGGAHNDIFKDDVVHLMWAMAHRDLVSRKPERSAAFGYLSR